MANSDFVDIFNSRDQLLEEATAFLFLQSLAFHNIVEELAAIGVLHNEE
jgi:zinc transporter ZupT